MLIQFPVIENFIINILDTSRGIQIPALIHSIMETFSREGVSKQHLSDPALLQYINNLMMQKPAPQNNIPTNIGRGVGLKTEDPNKEAFTLLVPDKSSK